MRTVEVNDTVLQGPGIVLQGPGIVLQGPGIVLQGPGIVLQGPGIVLQGPGLVLQGIEFNGPGVVWQGPGVVWQGPGIVLQGSTLSGVAIKEGVEYPVSGLDFIGAEMELRLQAVVGGEEMTEVIIVRINDIKQSGAFADVYLYDLTYRAQGSAEWLPYCGSPGVAAVPMANYWDPETGDRIDDPNVVTFACANAALAKCAILGYRPWAAATSCEGKNNKQTCGAVSLQDHHQACTRMLRADYCGTGQSRTVDGTAIDVWDDLSPEIQTQFTDWPVEAEWTAEGASCVNFTRHPELGYPECFQNKHGKPLKFNKCGSFADEDSLLANSFSPDAQ
jgi:hypothetical protein